MVISAFRSRVDQAALVAKDPLGFALRVLKAFRANQGFLLAGGVAYYTLLSIVPLLILMLIALSHLIDPNEILATLGRYLEMAVPGQSNAIMGQLAALLGQGCVIGGVLRVS